MDHLAKNMHAISDMGLLALMGSFIKQHRLRQNKTQQQVAEVAGINRSTLIQIEAGGGGNMLSFIQIIRALDQLSVLKNFELTELISPILLAKMRKKERQRGGYRKAELPNLSTDKTNPE